MKSDVNISKRVFRIDRTIIQADNKRPQFNELPLFAANLSIK